MRISRAYKMHTQAAKQIRPALRSNNNRLEHRAKRREHIRTAASNVTHMEQSVVRIEQGISPWMLPQIIKVCRFPTVWDPGCLNLEPRITFEQVRRVRSIDPHDCGYMFQSKRFNHS